MAVINSDQSREITYISGVTAQGAVAAQSFWTWNRNSPATYSTTLSYEAKWGAAQAGTPGMVNIAFDPTSCWGLG